MMEPKQETEIWKGEKNSVRNKNDLREQGHSSYPSASLVTFPNNYQTKRGYRIAEIKTLFLTSLGGVKLNLQRHFRRSLKGH